MEEKSFLKCVSGKVQAPITNQILYLNLYLSELNLSHSFPFSYFTFQQDKTRSSFPEVAYSFKEILDLFENFVNPYRTCPTPQIIPLYFLLIPTPRGNIIVASILKPDYLFFNFIKMESHSEYSHV